MDEAKQKLLTRIQEASNVLVTVSTNPSLDQLAGAIGMTLLLNKMGKHATAVFSGKVPSSIEYLKPEQTLEKDTNSLRDFIIALDKSKADKLRYKVEDKVVKIFITPYRTSLSQDDLEFSQGDFNVDLVIALGVHDTKDLDQAITSHGRILHDATVSSINVATGNEMGTINIVDSHASSLCEVLFGVIQGLNKTEVLDGQMATALLTGIVAETKRYSNEKTTAKTLDISGQLMAAGANQQLVAARLELPGNLSTDDEDDDEGSISLKDDKDDSGPSGSKGNQGGDKSAAKDKGTLNIDHTLADIEADVAPDKAKQDKIEIDEKGNLHRLDDELPEPVAQALPDVPPVLKSDSPSSSLDNLAAGSGPTAPGVKKFADKRAFKPPVLNSNLSEPQPDMPDPSLEPGSTAFPAETPLTETKPDLGAARDAVMDAVNANPTSGPLPPRIDLNANPVVELKQQPPAPMPPVPPAPPTPVAPPSTPALMTMPMPGPAPMPTPAPNPPAPAPATDFPASLVDTTTPPTDNSARPLNNPLAPPPVPPPLMPADFGSVPPTAPTSPAPAPAPTPTPIPPQPPGPFPPQQ